MKKLILLPALFISGFIYAQIPEDVLRYSFFPQNGTARNQAIGGAMGSLGGDISAIFVNPAGLGNYKTGEIVFNFLFSIGSFACVMVPISMTLPLDVQFPELFPGLAVPMVFFPALSWYTVKPLFTLDPLPTTPSTQSHPQRKTQSGYFSHDTS